MLQKSRMRRAAEDLGYDDPFVDPINWAKALAGTAQIRFSKNTGRMRTAQIWLVQKANVFSGNGGTTVVVPLANVDPNSDLVVMVCPTQATTVSSVTITGAGTTFVKQVSTTNGVIPAEMWKGINTAAVANPSITVTFAATLTSNADVTVLEFGGLDTTGANITSRFATGTSTTPSTGVLATTVANNVFVSVLNVASGGSVTAQEAGWVAAYLPTAGNNLVEYKINTTTGSPNATATLAASVGWTMLGMVLSK